MQLTEHFSLEELTITSNQELQADNRILSSEQIEKLRLLAQHCENIRTVCGNVPLRIHSGYRSLALNGATLGSSGTSQHPRCEAVDFDIPGQTVDESFNELLQTARAGNFRFGQLIIEQANRGGDIVRWVHCSVIGTLDPAKVGQVMKMTAAADGAPHYLMIDQLKWDKSI